MMYDPEKYILITDSVCNIPQRVKEIDRGYFVLWNRITGRFEIHHKGNKGSSYCLTVPWNELDARTIDLIHKTKSENAKKIFAEMERNNEKLRLDKLNKFKDENREFAKEIWNYAKSDPYSVECDLNKKVVRH